MDDLIKEFFLAGAATFIGAIAAWMKFTQKSKSQLVNKKVDHEFEFSSKYIEKFEQMHLREIELREKHYTNIIDLLNQSKSDCEVALDITKEELEKTKSELAETRMQLDLTKRELESAEARISNLESEFSKFRESMMTR